MMIRYLGATCILCLLAAPLLAQPPVSTQNGSFVSQPAVQTIATRRRIDKSCIMMCDKWGDKGCDKWVMRCKGDPGYPKGLNLSR